VKSPWLWDLIRPYILFLSFLPQEEMLEKAEEGVESKAFKMF
jgi:hypothetical protein